MGLFTKIKNMFSKNIECGDEVENHFIYFYPLKGRIVNIGCNIVVRNGFQAVFVCGDKVCDVISCGKHKITGATLPIAFDKLNLNVPNKYDNLPKKFKADLYFIKCTIIKSVSFDSNIPFVAKSESFGKVKGYCEGVFDVQVTDASKLIRFMLNDCAYLKNKQAEKKLKYHVGNKVNIMLEKSRLRFSEILSNPKTLYNHLNLDINEKLSSLGISVNNVEVTSLRLSRKMQKIVSEYLANHGNVPETNIFGNQLESPYVTTPMQQSVESNYVNNSANTFSQNKNSANVSEQQQNQYLQQNYNQQQSYKQDSCQNQNNYKNNYENVNAQKNNTGYSYSANNTSVNDEKNDASNQPQAGGEFNPFLLRRGGVQNVQNNQNNSFNVSNTNINASENLLSGENKKQCKYCGTTIDIGCNFCPKCGFKQN